jgi:hypothetical protein
MSVKKQQIKFESQQILVKEPGFFWDSEEKIPLTDWQRTTLRAESRARYTAAMWVTISGFGGR